MSRKWWRGKKLRSLVWKTSLYVILGAGSVFYLIPLVWTVSSSLKPLSNVFIFPPQWIPNPVKWSNYSEITNLIPIFTFVRNSLMVCSFTIPGYLLSSSLCAYGFARLRFPGREVLFVAVLMMMMVPWMAVFTPQYILFSKLGWIDTYLPMIVPPFFAVAGGSFFIFLLRQFFLSLPKPLEDSARIDGCSTFSIYLRIALPLAKPALGLVAIFSFIWTWNDFITPLIYLRSLSKLTLPVGLSMAQGMYQTWWHYLMAITVIAMIPCITVFIVFQRYFIQGIKITGVKE